MLSSCAHPPCIGIDDQEFSICRVASKAAVDGEVDRCVQAAEDSHPHFSTDELEYACRRQVETLEVVGEICGCAGSLSKPQNPRVCQWAVDWMCASRPNWVCHLKSPNAASAWTRAPRAPTCGSASTRCAW